METGVVKYDITDAAIAEMESIYMELTITDLDDKEQFDAVHSARMTVKGKRVEVEKRRKELKADALAYGKVVDAEAKRITGKLEPIEGHLEREEEKVTNEQKRIKAEADRKEKEKIDMRIAGLAEFGQHLPYLPFFEVAGWDDAKYDEVLLEAKEKHEAEKKRLAEEEAARKTEIDRLERVRLEQAVESARLAEAQKKIDDAKDRLESEKKALEDAKKAEQERKDREIFEVQAKENARIAAEGAAAEKAQREAREAKEKADKEAAEKARQEALKPDKEKLGNWALGLVAIISPDVKDEKAQGIVLWAEAELSNLAEKVIKMAEEL